MLIDVNPLVHAVTLTFTVLVAACMRGLIMKIFKPKEIPGSDIRHVVYVDGQARILHIPVTHLVLPVIPPKGSHSSLIFWDPLSKRSLG